MSYDRKVVDNIRQSRARTDILIYLHSSKFTIDLLSLESIPTFEIELFQYMHQLFGISFLLVWPEHTRYQDDTKHNFIRY